MNKNSLINLIKDVLYDKNVDITLKHKIAIKGRELRDKRVNLSLECFKINNILNSYILKKKQNIPTSVKKLYEYTMNRGRRYQDLPFALLSPSMWLGNKF